MIWTDYYNWTRGVVEGVTVYLYSDRFIVYAQGYDRPLMIWHDEPIEVMRAEIEKALQ